MDFKFAPFRLQLLHPFTVASCSRTTTPCMLVTLEYNGVVGYGEASLPPYLKENLHTVAQFYQRIDLRRFNDPFQMEDILHYIDEISPKNTAAKAAIDIALHDLVGKLLGQPWHKIWGYSSQKIPPTSFTIGIDNEEVVRQKTLEAQHFERLKVKLGADNDQQMIQTIRSLTQVPLCVDANQGWTDKYQALDNIHWLATQNVLFVEQPMPKNQLKELSWLTEHSPLPIIADESVQRLEDIPRLREIFSGINIKLMKASGMREAHKMFHLAKALGMKTMLGCMTETSCAISAAAQLASLADWVDLDGNLLISNDIFDGVKAVRGKIVLNSLPGIGVIKKGLE
ncbi:dipeptide epimerase [Capnocytophaga canimorsus]|uniref:dipeptide epimerase n=1 Tax=Capnocytophaga canimorsus TaxID=28188 RepID=UPI0037CE50C3